MIILYCDHSNKKDWLLHAITDSLFLDFSCVLAPARLHDKLGKNLHCKQALIKMTKGVKLHGFFFNECLSSSSAQIISKTTQSRHFAPFE